MAIEWIQVGLHRFPAKAKACLSTEKYGSLAEQWQDCYIVPHSWPALLRYVKRERPQALDVLENFACLEANDMEIKGPAIYRSLRYGLFEPQDIEIITPVLVCACGEEFLSPTHPDYLCASCRAQYLNYELEPITAQLRKVNGVPGS